jgi:ABC-2 type transport system ATP-binding protein
VGSGILHVALSDPAEADAAAVLLAEKLGGIVQRGTEAARLSVRADTARNATDALAALSAAGIGIEDFSMGSPSLDEVFFALTGQPADEEGALS